MKTSWEQGFRKIRAAGDDGSSEFRRFEHKPFGELQKKTTGAEKERRDGRIAAKAL